jgi:hypothetical protein
VVPQEKRIRETIEETGKVFEKFELTPVKVINENAKLAGKSI